MAQIIDRYTYRVTWSEEDQEHVGLCVEFPGLSWLEASPEAALAGIHRVVADCVEDMKAADDVAPEPIAVKHYSGKAQLGAPPVIRPVSMVSAAAITSFPN